ncbi:MAG: winged helix-turn-helix transcriptional regulator [Bacteroidales bacterium]|jgi:predicted HTH transcriptional regulator|nr:winged helix-turn-helix transcriptional regulator [Bacteroidales bacterium]
MGDILNDRNKVCVNILLERHIYVQQVEGKDVIVMEVPRAERRDKPVYINNDLNKGTFRRNAEGDYHCSMPEIKAMLRDQSDISPDSRVIEELTIADLDRESVNGYRNHFAALKPAHIWNRLDIESFLQKIGASGRSESGHLKPTLAGLLMFGTEDVITGILPDYFLDYREVFDSRRWTDRTVSNLGEWSGNIFDFFFRVVNKLTAGVKVPFRLRNGTERISDTPVHEALREALANAVIHADYYGRQGIVIEKRPDMIVISNPGIFRPNKEDAFNGGVSDPRNPVIFKMFALLNIGERAGSGLFNIKTIWQEEGWKLPVWEEKFNPERIKLSIPVEMDDVTGKVIEEVAENIFDTGKVPEKVLEKVPEKVLEKVTENQRLILDSISKNQHVTIRELSVIINISERKIRENMVKLKAKGLLERIGPDKGGYWKINNAKDI